MKKIVTFGILPFFLGSSFFDFGPFRNISTQKGAYGRSGNRKVKPALVRAAHVVSCLIYSYSNRNVVLLEWYILEVHITQYYISILNLSNV